MFKTLILALLLAIVPAAWAEEPDHASHEALRGLLQGIERAINEERYTDLAAFFHERLRVTTINQEVLRSREEIAPYFQRWFGPGGYLKKLHITLTADDLTELYGDKRYGIVIGSGLEKYLLADGRSYDMQTRWTATVIQDTDGQWRILALHVGTNFLDNPILGEAESALLYAVTGGALAGAVLAALLIWLFRRNRRS